MPWFLPSSSPLPLSVKILPPFQPNLKGCLNFLKPFPIRQTSNTFSQLFSVWDAIFNKLYSLEDSNRAADTQICTTLSRACHVTRLPLKREKWEECEKEWTSCEEGRRAVWSQCSELVAQLCLLLKPVFHHLILQLPLFTLLCFLLSSMSLPFFPFF